MTYASQSHPHLQSSQHAFPLSPSKPSLAMIGAITSPATGSAHHHWARAFKSKPPKRIADRYVQKSVCRESACMAPLPIPAATLLFALASNGITITETAAGQTVPHAHVHVIPRWNGDVPDPRGGARWVIPGKADYWRKP
jgi:hypothetical protein